MPARWRARSTTRASTAARTSRRRTSSCSMAPERSRRGPSLVRILETILEVAPEVPVLVVHQGARAPALPAPAQREHRHARAARCARSCARRWTAPSCASASSRCGTSLAGKDRVGILLQDDPDPDAMASGLALRALLGRTRATAPLLSFGRITRPENLAMVEALEIEVEQVTPEALRGYDALAMVDIQPTFCEEAPPAGRGGHRPPSRRRRGGGRRSATCGRRTGRRRRS